MRPLKSTNRTHGRYALNQETQVEEEIVVSHSRDDPKTDFDINHRQRINFNKISIQLKKYCAL